MRVVVIVDISDSLTGLGIIRLALQHPFSGVPQAT